MSIPAPVDGVPPLDDRKKGDRQESVRAAAVFAGLALGTITLVCAAFLVTGVALPEWFVLLGRWIPALLTLVVIRGMRLPGGVAHWWALRPGGRRRLLGGVLTATFGLLAVYGASALVAASFGIVTPLPRADYVNAAIVLLPAVALFSLSTLGEEAAWRGFLQRLLSGWGHWRSSAAVSAAWVLFHVPLHATMVVQGVLPATAALASTALLFPLGLFLGALTTRYGSIWPAVFAHALPLSVLNLVANPSALPPAGLWALHGITAVLVAAAAAVVAGRPRRA